MVVVAYLRVSTVEQADKDTISIQRHAVAEYCRRHGHKLSRTFSDDGVSGTREPHERAGWGELYLFLESNPEVEGVVVFKVDRLARTMRIQENVIHDLTKKGKRILSVKENDLDGMEPERILLRQILGSFSEYERRMIVMRMKLGRLAKARRGGYAGGAPAFGYRSSSKGLVRVDEQLDVVRRIFIMKRNKHMGLRRIAKRLNEDGVPTRQGGPWQTSTIKGILANPMYRGIMRYKDEQSKVSQLGIF